jgi:D-Tyr-tRNAtyr deacylase
VVGSGLELDGEVIQLSAFTVTAEAAEGRIARPSQRAR